MKFLLLNQTFHPDVMATGQYLTEVAKRLVERGHEVTVVTSRRAYDQPETRFPAYETWSGIRIYRVASSGFGKGAKWRRAADFASFIAMAALRLFTLPKHDVVVALTSPPLISFLGAALATLRRSRFVYWVMDFNPDEAIAAGWLTPGSLATRVLEALSRFSLKHATKIIALDRFMRDRIVAKGIAPDKIAVIPPWSHDKEVRFNPEGRERFRKTHGLEGKFVVMYSGNHSPCHPLDTLLGAARRLADDPRIAFCFVGGGSEFRKIQQMVNGSHDNPRGSRPTNHTLKEFEALNVSHSASSLQRPTFRAESKVEESQLSNSNSKLQALCLPYQPLAELAGSLSAADLHVVVLGEPFVGLIHPCKIYNALAVGAPILFIGPEPSHLSEILRALDSRVCAGLRHGEVEECAKQISRIAAGNHRGEPTRYEAVTTQFSQQVLIASLLAELENDPSHHSDRSVPAH